MALEAARIYAKIAPASSHALHMPSHAFLPLGMWDEAVASDEASFAASVAWVKRTGRTPAQQDFHSLSWLHYEYLQQGRFAKARDASETVRRALSDVGPSVSSGATGGPGAAPDLKVGPAAQHHVESEIGRGYGAMSLRSELASMRARAVIESRDWVQMKGQTSFENIDELLALGLSSVGLGDLSRAEAAIDHLRKASGSLPDGDLRELAAIMAAEVSGVLQFARGARERGLQELAGAAEAERKRPKPIARPYPVKPAAELYGEFLLASGDANGAIAQFQASLARTPRRAASLFGLAAAAAAAGVKADAARAAREFLDVWHLADSGRPELADARAILTGTR
jgi:tetratricopeptide (TPR) repeat protein